MPGQVGVGFGVYVGGYVDTMKCKLIGIIVQYDLLEFG